MARTQATGLQILDGSIQRIDLDITSAGQAVIRKVVAGSNISITETGVDAGTGDVTINATDFTTASYPSLQFTTNNNTQTWSEGLLYYDPATKSLTYFNDEAEVALNIGQETFMRVYNNTGGPLLNGKAITVVGIINGVPSVDYAIANDLDSAANCVGLATHDIETGTFGYVTTRGFVRGLDTQTPGFTTGARLYLSDTVAGDLTETPPNTPEYVIEMGGNAAPPSLTEGIIYCEVRNLGNKGGTTNFFNGAIYEDHTVTVASNGTTIPLTLDNNEGGSFVSLFFSGEFFKLTTPVAVDLIAGSDTVPALNYVYIPETTKVLTVNNTGFPATSHIRIATAVVPTAATALTDGLYKLHAWTDHIKNVTDGHLAHLNEWIRNQHATWLSGVATTFSGSGTATVGLATTSGTVLQLHTHSFPAYVNPAPIYIVNHPTTPYLKVTNIGDIAVDANNVSLRNKTYALVFWGVVSEDDGDCKIMCTLPGGSYPKASPDSAREDTLKYTDYSIPAKFRGTGFLFYRLILESNTAGTVITLYPGGSGDDLRGTFPNTVAGGTTTLGTTFVDGSFVLQNTADTTKQLTFNLANITTATTRTLVVPDKSGTIATVADTKRNAMIWG